MPHSLRGPAPARPMATVIPIAPEARRAARLAMADERAVRMLESRYGTGWISLPPRTGRPAAAAEALLRRAPAAIDPTRWGPGPLLQRAHLLEAAARTTGEAVTDDAEVLGEALHIDLTALPLHQLLDIAGAVVDLSTAPAAASAWGHPDAARIAELVLESVGADLRTAKRLQHDVYEACTEAVWSVPVAVLHGGRARWRLLSRRRLRRHLAAVSRSGRPPGRLAEAADLVLEARAARGRVASMASLLSGNLGELDRGPNTEVDDALDALVAVRRLQATLGEALDTDRLCRLLQAHAFHTPEVFRPATSLRSTLQAWVRQVTMNGGHEPLQPTSRDLVPWADGLTAGLPALEAGLRATSGHGLRPVSAHALVDDLLLREHLDDLEEHLGRAEGDGQRVVS
ncbi:MAG: hypothetical protein ACSLFP_12885 [Acidimicrobiales bacterium]